ncbi:MAG TPA: hypothetical protein VI757_11095 [Bacteroidia bacterium]|nr:hypothetical protein [Bacteroidia bacterium]
MTYSFIKDKRITFTLLAVIFRLLLDRAYVNISGIFEYLGIVYSPRAPFWIFFSYALLAFVAYTIPQNHNRPSTMILLFLFLISYIPITTFYALNSFTSVMPLLCVTFIFFAINLAVRDSGLLKMNMGKLEVQPSTFSFFLLMFSVLAYAVLIYRFGFINRIPSFSEIRELREAYREEDNRIIIYIFKWQSSVINPILFILGLLFRNVWLIALSITGQLYLYSVGGHKAIFFINFLVLFVFIGMKYFSKTFNNFILVSLIMLVILLMGIDYLINDYSLLSSILVRRMFLVPAQFFYYYYEYFSVHPVDFFAQNFPFSVFLSSHYSMEIPYLIADYFVNKASIHANANMFADSYANLGLTGFFIIGFIFLLILKFLDSVSRFKNTFVILPLLSFSVINIANSSLITTLITHGFLFTLFVITIMPFASRKQTIT